MFAKLLGKDTITNQFYFRKGYSTQQCLLVMIEKWCQSLDKGGHYGTLLTDSSNTFDCLSHDLLIANLHAYGFHIPALRLLHNYLTNRKQCVKMDCTCSSGKETLIGVPQGSILWPLLFNIFFMWCNSFHKKYWYC